MEKEEERLLAAIRRAQRLEGVAWEILRNIEDVEGTLSDAKPQLYGFAGSCMGHTGSQYVYDCYDGSVHTCPTPTFNCTASDPEFYFCGRFTCTDTSGFACKSSRDYVCYLQYSCATYTCDEGHLFDCETDHSCITFSCRSTAVTNCTGVSDNVYNNGTDTTAGDFYCLFWGGSATFDCQQTFSCTPATDFGCGINNLSASFSCGNNDSGDTFICPQTANFDCIGTFSCVPSAAYGQCTTSVSFICTTRYTPCRGQYECLPGASYTCPSSHTCIQTYGCNPSFTCNTFICPASFVCTSQFVCGVDVDCGPGNFTCGANYMPPCG